ncbi:unnamed protein product [Schistocephalus solidus]|uniref:AAI domain-containing protein n=1 Tax=Schistocephalus solidus TaxID=70667 RepID=A0A183TR12_SCHSO|nr:unnamed protein product [Schistocephalus solidus]
MMSMMTEYMVMTSGNEVQLPVLPLPLYTNKAYDDCSAKFSADTDVVQRMVAPSKAGARCGWCWQRLNPVQYPTISVSCSAMGIAIPSASHIMETPPECNLKVTFWTSYKCAVGPIRETGERNSTASPPFACRHPPSFLLPQGPEE